MNELLTFIVTKQLPKDAKNPRTKQLSPFPGDFIDPRPVIRSFLLQLMLRVDSSLIEPFLQRFIDENETIMEASSQLPELCIMIIHCIEDSKNRRQKESTRMVVGHMLASMNNVFDQRVSLVRSLALTAEDRLAVNRLGHALHDLLTGAADEDDQRELMKTAEDFFHRHPQAANLKKYLVRYIAAKYQQNAVIEWKRRQVFTTFLPDDLLNMSAVEAADVFLIIDSDYKVVRNAISHAWITGDYTGLGNMVLQHGKNSRTWALAFHTLTLVNPCLPTDQAPFDLFLREHSWLRTIWIENRDSCPQLRGKTHRHLAVSGLHVHFAAIVEDSKLSHMLQIFRVLARNPSNAQNLFLPTMPQDETLEAKAAVRDATSWYMCTNGHAYAIGDCGQPAFEGKCPSCSAPVGGQGHRFVHSPGQAAQLVDTTQPGHILGVATAGARSTTVREISGLEVAVIRFLLHTAMLEGSQANPEDVARLIKPRPPEPVAEFLIAHLLLNLRQISECLGRSEDDVVVLLHQIIENLAKFNYSPGQSTLNTKDAVRTWEKDFCRSYFRPAVSDLDTSLVRHRTAVKEDKEEASNVLLDIIHEPPATLTNRSEILSLPQIWQPRMEITLDRLESKLGGPAKFKELCPVLFHLVKEEMVLKEGV